MDASRPKKRERHGRRLSLIFFHLQKMFHQNLSPTNIDTREMQQQLVSDGQAIESIPAISEIIDEKETMSTQRETDLENFSPIREKSLRRLTVTPMRLFAPKNEDTLTSRLSKHRSPTNTQARPRSLAEELEDVTTSFSQEQTPAADSAYASNSMSRESSAVSLISVESDVDAEASDVEEEDMQSNFSLENAQLLEARTDTVTRVTPSPLRPWQRSNLSPIPEASREGTPQTDGSTTLVEIQDAHHQSPTSTGDNGFSPYAEESGSSQPTLNSPCERIPLGHLNASLLAATPSRPSPLREVAGVTHANARALNLEDFELPALPVSPHVPATPLPRRSAELSAPLSVPLGSVMTPQTGRIDGTQLLIAINAYITHVTPERRDRFLGRVQTVLLAHLPATQAQDRDSSSSSETPAHPPVARVEASSSSEQALLDGMDQMLSMIQSPSNPSSVNSEAGTPLDRPFASFSRAEILDKLAKNNDDLRDMIMSWRDHPQAPQSPGLSPACSTNTPRSSVARRRFSGHTAASLARVASSPQSPQPSPSTPSGIPRLSACGTRRFSDHTYASLNRSLQTTESRVPTPVRSKRESMLPMPRSVKSATPNIIAPAPPTPSLPRGPSKFALKLDKLNKENATSKLPLSKTRPSLTQSLRPMSPNSRIIPRQSPTKLPIIKDWQPGETPRIPRLPRGYLPRPTPKRKPEYEVETREGLDELILCTTKLVEGWNGHVERSGPDYEHLYVDVFEPEDGESDQNLAYRFTAWSVRWMEVVNGLQKGEFQSAGRRDSANFDSDDEYQRALELIREESSKLTAGLGLAREISQSLLSREESREYIVDSRVGEMF